jgi:hypothetical protein
MQIIAELKLTALGESLVPLLDSPDPALQRRAVSVLGQIGSHAADDKLLALLRPETEEKLLKVVVEAVTNLALPLDQPVLITLLTHPSFAVRDTTQQQLTTHFASYGPMLRGMLLDANLSDQTPAVARAVMRIYTGVQAKPDMQLIDRLYPLLGHSDAGVRIDAVQLISHWDRLTFDDPELNSAFGGMTGLSRDVSGMLETTSPADHVYFIPQP